LWSLFSCGNLTDAAEEVEGDEDEGEGECEGEYEVKVNGDGQGKGEGEGEGGVLHTMLGLLLTRVRAPLNYLPVLSCSSLLLQSNST
jgi:hypothetical protein